MPTSRWRRLLDYGGIATAIEGRQRRSGPARRQNLGGETPASPRTALQHLLPLQSGFTGAGKLPATESGSIASGGPGGCLGGRISYRGAVKMAKILLNVGVGSPAIPGPALALPATNALKTGKIEALEAMTSGQAGPRSRALIHDRASLDCWRGSSASENPH